MLHYTLWQAATPNDYLKNSALSTKHFDQKNLQLQPLSKTSLKEVKK